jgi:hypothetical protein
MKKFFRPIINEVKNNIIRDMRDVNSPKGYETLKIVLAAYNLFQEEERDGVDYIFDINNVDDLKCCIDGGMTAKEIGGLYLGSHNNHLPYFYFGCNYPQPLPINTWDELRMDLVAWLDELLPYVIAYPQTYKDLYQIYITDKLSEENEEESDLEALVRLKRMMEGR